MAVETHEFIGEVDAIEMPSGRGPARVTLGFPNGQYRKTKKFIVWLTDFETKQPNGDVTTLQHAHEAGQSVKVIYGTKEKENREGKKYPENTIYEAEIEGAAAPAWGATTSSADLDWGTPTTTESPSKAPESVPTASESSTPTATHLIQVLEACNKDVQRALEELRKALA